jgi:hypothetical protein
MRYEVLTAVKMAMLVFWVVTSCGLGNRYQRFGETYCLHFSPEDGDSMFLRNVVIYLHFHTALQTRRPTSTKACSVGLLVELVSKRSKSSLFIKLFSVVKKSAHENIRIKILNTYWQCVIQYF